MSLEFPRSLVPILLLVASNVFMTFAWYGHLKYKASPLLIAIVASWGIAFFEYCLAVPANRIGTEVYSTAQLKTMQEVITLIVFAGFSVLYLKEPLGGTTSPALPASRWALISSSTNSDASPRRCDAEDFALCIVHREPQRTIRPRSHITDAPVERQAFLALHGIALDFESHQGHAGEGAHEQAVAPWRDRAGIEGRP